MTTGYLHVTLALVLLAAWPQDKSKPSHERPGVVPNKEEVTVRTRYQRLKNPTFIAMELVPMPRDGQSENTPFRVGDRLRFQLLMTQNLNEPLDIVGTDIYDQDRPELLHDGDAVPYKKRVAELVKKKDEKLEIFSEKPMTIQPGQPSAIAIIDLDEWFNRLPVGHYQLSVRHRFVWGGEWVQSSAVTFEIQQEGPK